MDEDQIERIAELARQVDKAATAASKAGYSMAEDGEWRRPSKARQIGTGSRGGSPGETPQPGEFLKAVMLARSRDASEQAEGKATLEGLSRYMDEADVRAAGSKATLGTTDATGGWIIPNAVVDQIEKPATYNNPYRSLLTVRPGVLSATVDIPFRSARPSRAVIAAFGATKENLDLAYNGYTATMYTLARIYDIGAQFVRQSAGAAEQDVLGELATAFALGEQYYIINGAGTTEPYGLKTALAAGPATFRTTFSPVGTTLAGSVLKAISTASGALLARGRTPTAAVMSATAYAEMIGQGSDTAGFWVAGLGEMPLLAGFRPGTLISPWGVPVIPDSEFEADDLIVGDWDALKLYLGDSYRVDSSDVAGDRWDQNLVGFRGEEEIGLDARPAVYAGAFQLIEDILP